MKLTRLMYASGTRAMAVSEMTLWTLGRACCFLKAPAVAAVHWPGSVPSLT